MAERQKKLESVNAKNAKANPLKSEYRVWWLKRVRGSKYYARFLGIADNRPLFEKKEGGYETRPFDEFRDNDVAFMREYTSQLSPQDIQELQRINSIVSSEAAARRIRAIQYQSGVTASELNQQAGKINRLQGEVDEMKSKIRAGVPP